MEDIALYILKKYGYSLSIEELNSVLQWFENNNGNIVDEDDLDLKLRGFLYEEFPEKILYLCEEDTSNMNYLLQMLKDIKKS